MKRVAVKMFEENLMISQSWVVTNTDTLAQYMQKKSRIYWSLNRTELHEDYVVDGYSKIKATLSRFYRTQSKRYALGNDNLVMNGIDYHRYEFKDGSIEEETRPMKDSFQLLSSLFN